jgi:heme exporter protein A
MGTRQASQPSITLENVAVIRGDRLVLQQLSFKAGAGDIIWVRGANGCGKSTLLRCVAGLLTIASGNMAVTGKVAMADENMALEAGMPLEKALNFWADMDGAGGALRNSAMTAMDLLPLAEVPVRYLSTGQRRRAVLACVFASGAPIWLLDEPYNGLDNANSARLDAALLRHAAAGGIALVAAHQPPVIAITETIVLDKSNIKAEAI